MIAIEKGLSIPRGGRPKSDVRATMEVLGVNDSFIYPTLPDGDLKKTGVYAGRTAAYLRPKQFARRTVMEDGKWVVRVWRVA